MSRKCDLTAKSSMRGNKVSHAKNRSLREFGVNLQIARLYSETAGRKYRLKVATSTIRLIDKLGGFDKFIARAKPAQLNPELRRLRKRILNIS